MIGTKFNIIDLSKIPEQTTIETPDAAPVILTAFPSAKGTEKLIQSSGTDDRKMFGDPDYKKYGQGSVQNQRMIDSGAKLLCKRVYQILRHSGFRWGRCHTRRQPSWRAELYPHQFQPL